jgi:hypothetical protein
VSDTKRWSWGTLVVDGVLALICASQIAAPGFQNLGYVGEIVAFVIVFLILYGANWIAVQKGWNAYGRAALTAALFLSVLIINISSATTACDRHHQNCHRYFSLRWLVVLVRQIGTHSHKLDCIRRRPYERVRSLISGASSCR